MTGYFYGKQIVYNYGDVEATSYSRDGTSLKIVIPEGYFSGTDSTTISSSDFVASKILDSATIFGLAGTIPTISSDQVATTISNDGTTLKLKAPSGYYDGTKNVKVTDANFLAENIKKGVNLFGIDGDMMEGGGGIWATGQTATNSAIPGDDGSSPRGGIYEGEQRYTTNLNGTVTDDFTGLTWALDIRKLGMDGTTALKFEGNWVESSKNYIVGDAVTYPPTVSNYWQPGQNYVVGDRVMGEMGSDIFKCIMNHTSDLDNSPPWGGEAMTYWEYDNYPGPANWQNSTSYVVGDTVSYQEMDWKQNYVCIIAHTSSWQTAPGEMEGPSKYWAEINTKFVCNQAHTSDLVKHCFNKSYWSELPLVGYQQNLDNYKEVSIKKAFYIAENISHLGFTWAIPNVIELLTIANFGKTSGAKTDFPGFVSPYYGGNTNEFFTSTVGNTDKNSPYYYRLNMDNLELRSEYNSTYKIILLKTGVKT